MNYKAWVAKSAKQRMVLETVDLGSLGAEDVEVAVEHCGVCHSDLSVFNKYGAVLALLLGCRLVVIWAQRWPRFQKFQLFHLFRSWS